MMNRTSLRGLATIAVCLLLISTTALNAEQTAFYVSPSGNDQWSGKLPDANAAWSDGPFATVTRARDVVRGLVSKSQEAGPIMIYLRGGTYALSAPLVLGPQDSGTPKNPVIWSAYQNEKPILSGGQRVVGWSQTRVNGHDAWVAKLPSGSPEMIHALWVNGRRMIRARWPVHGTLGVESITEKRPRGEYHPGVVEFHYHSGDLKPWSNPADGEVIACNRWVESHLPITAIKDADHLIQFGKRSLFLLDQGDPYWVENVRELLTEPSEFYVDPREHLVYLIPPAGVDPNAAEVIAPRLSEVLILGGDPSSGNYVEHLHFRGLSFCDAEWYLDRPEVHEARDASKPAAPVDSGRSGFGQAAVGVPGAVLAFGARDCEFDRCSFSHNNTYGIELAQGCQHNRITHCTMTDLGAGGVKIGETAVRTSEDRQAFANEVSDCTISDGGNLFPSCVALWIGQSHDNVISHNDIHSFWYTAISVGWTWGYGPAISQRNVIEYNHIHHIGIKHDGDAPILSDMGGIYTLGNQEGTVIRFNRFHDIAGLHYGGWGIYFDEGTTHILAENNLVYRTTHGGFHQHYGKENIFRNNIIAFGRDNQIQRTRIEDHQSFSFERNIVLWDEGVLLTGSWKELKCAFDHNTYWYRGKGDVTFAGKSWQQWQQAGMDENSKLADPHLANPMEGDFRLTEKSQAALAGFQPFDLSTVGPR